jgi:hypothetical protein
MYTLADEGPMVMTMFSLGLVGAVLIAAVATYYVAKLIVEGVRRDHAAKLEAQARENQDRLKSLMIQRGMSADEIERILQAEGSRPDYAREAGDIEAQMVEALSENGYEAADIERILRVARGESGAVSADAGKLVEILASNWAKAADIERILQTRKKPATV